MSKEPKRPYRKRKRAEAEEETRRRITEAAMELHGTVGPANTKLTDVAERAGVSRMTVYNHFPSDTDLFMACSSHWASRNPFPDPTSWTKHTDPEQRLVSALRELYGWYDRKQGMLEKVVRDAPLLPALREIMDQSLGGYTDDLVATLSEGWQADEEFQGQLEASLRLVVDFHTWRVLTDAGLTAAAAAELAARMVVGATSTMAP